MKANFKNLGPLLDETRTSEVCALCNNFIYQRVYFDENSDSKQKKVFVCKNCLKDKE
ncbi:MAG: hypothetical protein ACW96X_11980 [Promethearchaeota archaeon]|jgi:hypothetical protein